jgi:membrane protein YdbS with pleckstrin-like domain
VAAVFRSKVDLWLVAVLVGVPILVLEFFFEDIGLSDQSADLVVILLVAVVLAIFAWLYFTTRYSFTAEFLLVRSGPFSWNIPLQEISKIEPTHNPASSPALSLDRLVIYYNDGKELMVSPADKQGFMNELKTRTRQREAIR